MAMKRLMSLLTACLLLVPGLAAAEQFEEIGRAHV